MQSLIGHLYRKHISSTDPNMGTLSQCHPLAVHTLSASQLQFYSSLLVRNFLTYSPANMELRLSVKTLLGLYRLGRLEGALRGMGAGLAEVWADWLSNQMMPVLVDKGRCGGGGGVVYVDYRDDAQDKEKEREDQMIQEKKPQPQPIKTTKRKPKKSQQKAKQPQPQPQPQPSSRPQNTKVLAMVSIPELTIQLQNQILMKQLCLKAGDLKPAQKRVQAIQKYKAIKMEQYLNQHFNSSTLMTYNFIRAYPYIDQKSLLAKTMLSALELRKCLAALISEGFINFYQEGPRSVIFRALAQDRMEQKFTDFIAGCMVNVFGFLDKGAERSRGEEGDEEAEKRRLMLKSLIDLDEILMIFMA